MSTVYVLWELDISEAVGYVWRCKWCTIPRLHDMRRMSQWERVHWWVGIWIPSYGIYPIINLCTIRCLPRTNVYWGTELKAQRTKRLVRNTWGRVATQSAHRTTGNIQIRTRTQTAKQYHAAQIQFQINSRTLDWHRYPIQNNRMQGPKHQRQKDYNQRLDQLWVVDLPMRGRQANKW